MIEIVPMAKYMKGALDALEKYHNVYQICVRRYRLILISLLTKIQEEETYLNKLITSSLPIKEVLKTIAKILSARSDELGVDKSFCKLKHLDFDLLWNLWITESNTLIEQRKFQELFIFLSGKISNFIQTTITKKYSELGFIYDWNTSQTFLPVQPSTSDNHDIAQNPSTNFTQNTNYVNTQEAIQQNDITTYPSIQHTNNVETQENIRQEIGLFGP
ncbi:uncharacterized protein LOC126895291 isoform X2 [Daktulosphaira vitifoliae]|uniref:uncharacterized protein LOC126895291 isoform X2 n=1 Tax=Daktulosphaira vitifoliae TaxID=58002 RepID=UPI0021AA9E68|nr:uncharacterized protein LOC126895291 isoform X2 [Daktulosphaira vitifoliae]